MPKRVIFCNSDAVMTANRGSGRLLLRSTFILCVFLGLVSHVGAQTTGIVTGLAPQYDGSYTQGILTLVEGTHDLIVFGDGITLNTEIGFTDTEGSCVDSVHTSFLTNVSSNGLQGTFTLAGIEVGSFYMCVNDSFVATSTNSFALYVVEEEKSIAPIWLSVLIIAFLLCLSGLFSGLNLGLMALDTTGLQIIMKVGKEKQKKYAKKIYPLRKHGNLLLCTLLLGNVLVNNTLTIFLESVVGGGLIAVIGSTIAIVIFGEILPQSVCTRHGLAVGAHTIWITRVFVLVMFIFAYPISKILDWLLGRELGVMYSRQELKELVTLTGAQVNLNKAEMAMLGGVLDFNTRTVKQVMTKMSDVFMISVSAKLDFKTLKRIVESGHSRVPVYEEGVEGSDKKIVGILFVKDLTFVDPDDHIPLSAVIKFYDRQFNYVFEDTKLDEMLAAFKEGHCHLAVVRRVNNEGDGDPFYENLGIITLEDVLEEIIQSEIVDETDVVTDNITKNPVRRYEGKDVPFKSEARFNTESTRSQTNGIGPTLDFGNDTVNANVSSQLRLAILSFLTTSFEMFDESKMSRAVVERLVEKASYMEFFKSEGLDYNTSGCRKSMDGTKKGVLYEAGKKSDVFTIVLEGKVRVHTASDGLSFDAGPFSVLGLQGLSTPDYIPDFFAVTDLSDGLLMQISATQYRLARNATDIKRTASVISVSTDTSRQQKDDGTMMEKCPESIDMRSTLQLSDGDSDISSASNVRSSRDGLSGMLDSSGNVVVNIDP
eukprot:CFRG8562T1